eukprot:6198529-Pleurochrysis_carterae.AAC.3
MGPYESVHAAPLGLFHTHSVRKQLIEMLHACNDMLSCSRSRDLIEDASAHAVAFARVLSSTLLSRKYTRLQPRSCALCKHRISLVFFASSSTCRCDSRHSNSFEEWCDFYLGLPKLRFNIDVRDTVVNS